MSCCWNTLWCFCEVLGSFTAYLSHPSHEKPDDCCKLESATYTLLHTHTYWSKLIPVNWSWSTEREKYLGHLNRSTSSKKGMSFIDFIWSLCCWHQLKSIKSVAKVNGKVRLYSYFLRWVYVVFHFNSEKRTRSTNLINSSKVGLSTDYAVCIHNIMYYRPLTLPNRSLTSGRSRTSS